MYKTLRNLIRFQYRLAIRDQNSNPFDRLSRQQLEDYFSKNKRPSSLNTLIFLGLAMKKYTLMKEHLEILKLVSEQLAKQIHLNVQNPEEISYGKLLSLYTSSDSQMQKEPPSIILEGYINCYNFIVQNIEQHILIYKQLSTLTNKESSHNVSMAKTISQQKIHQHFASYAYNFTLEEYIQYIRLFINKISQNQEEFLETVFDKKQQIHLLGKQQKVVLHYLMKAHLKRDKQAQRLGFVTPPLFDFQCDTPKQVLMKLELWQKCYGKNTEDVVKDYIQNGYLQSKSHLWGFDQLVWLSDFLQKQGNIQHQLLHKSLISKRLGRINSLIDYIGNQSREHYQSLSEWLSKQDISSQQPESICSLLVYIGENGQPFKQFHKKVVQICLGKYEWEPLNIIYYFGLLWKTEDPNLEYVRRYILNGYAAMGVSRRDIPTSSYFYKILEISNAEEFYGNFRQQ